MTIKILEHSSRSYAPRTYTNASAGDITIAIAVDYNTAGERLTHKAAGDKYLKLDFQEFEPIDLARMLYKRLKMCNGHTINVAGNGIYTLAKHGYDQQRINQIIYRILSKVHEYFPITKIVSGGQTGVDLAGGIAGYTLGIDTVMTLPKGFIQRHEDKLDVEHTREEIMKQVENGRDSLETNTNYQS